MRNVSNQFLEAMKERRDFYAVAEITFANGTQKTLEKYDFAITGNSVADNAGTSSFPLGILSAKRIELTIMNDDDRWSEYDFYWAKIRLQTKFDLDDGTTEALNIGTFTVITPESYGTTITVTAMDDSYKTDKDYTTGLIYPVTVGEALRDSCQTCGVNLLTTTFANDDYIIPQKPEDLTHRQFIGICAMIAGGNARFDEFNRLKIMSYDLSGFESVESWDGGTFEPWTGGEDIDGGSFNPWTHGERADGGTFGDRANIHFLYQFKSGLKIEVDDVIITGVQIADSDKNVHLYGSEGYVLSLDNQLADGKEDEVANRIGQMIVGLRFRPFSGDHISLPTAEFMDLAVILDRKNNAYRTVLTDVDFTYFGFTTLKCSADSPIRNSSTYAGSTTKAIVEARRNTEQQLNDYDRTVQKMNDLIAQSFGVFRTEYVLEDGSVILYLHDKPTREESTNIWRIAGSVFSVSDDGGKTWKAGLDSQGNAVVNVLSAIGINFDWAHGGTLTLGGYNNTDGKLTILNNAGNQVGYIDNTGVHFNAGTLSFGNLFGVDASGNMTANSLKSTNASITGGSINITTTNQSDSRISLKYGDWTLNISPLQLELINPSISRRLLVQAGGMYLYYGNQIVGSWAQGGNNDPENVLNVGGSVYCSMMIATGTKNRAVNTPDFGKVLQYCYETASPMFGDIGTGKTDTDGTCYIYFDPVFAETVSTDCAYQVFLQKEGQGDIWIEEKHQGYFVVKGTPNLSFSWEAKAKQRDYEYERLEVFDDGQGEEADTDYAALAESYLTTFEKEIFDYESID